MINSLSVMTQRWDQALTKIEKRLGEKMIFDSFFANSYVTEIAGSTIVVVVKGTLAKNVILTKYRQIVQDAVDDIFGVGYEIEFITEEESQKREETGATRTQTTPQYFQDAALNKSLTFDNFVVGTFNREAAQAAKLIATAPGKMFNPLFLFSNAGLGKTHLMNAIGNEIKKNNPQSNVLYISAQSFIDEYMRFVKGDRESQSIRGFFKSVSVLLIDDIQFLENKVKTNEMFFTVYETLIKESKQIVITSDKQPVELSGLEERLVSRFSQGLVVKIEEPDKNSCVEILRQKIAATPLDINKVDESVLYLLADKFSHNVRELEQVVNRLVFSVYNLKGSDAVSLQDAIDAVSSLVGTNELSTQLNEQKIINVVADYYNLTPSQLTGKSREAQVALARHIAMYIIRNMIQDVSWSKIGDMFGGKDHTTVMNGVQKVDKLLKTDEPLKQAVEELEKRLKS